MRRLLVAVVTATSLLCLGALTWLPACAPDLGAVPFLCNQGAPSCPDGYVCIMKKYCVKEGTCPETIPGCATGNCGNGVCDIGEDSSSCAQDCQGDCGNGTCDSGEDPASCPSDCHCGNKVCDQGETPSTCPKDCPVSTCGDGTCQAPETHKNCATDCPAVCGDGVCDLGETSGNCPKDCPTTTCGNGTCETGETSTSCPQDCSGGSCTSGQTQCEGTDKLQNCTGGTWKTDDCATLCKSGGYDYSAGCGKGSGGKDVCSCGKYVKFGGVCSDTLKCDPSLVCGAFGSTATQGFCTKYCTTSCSGAPSGTYASCSINIGGKDACVFECDFLTPCPSALTCDDLAGMCKP
jgi:hypothetical protein